VGILAGLTLESVFTASASLSALRAISLSDDFTVLTNSRHSGSGSITTAAASAFATALATTFGTLTLNTGSTSTTVTTVTTAATTSVATTATTLGTSTDSLLLVLDLGELLTIVVDGGLGNLDDHLFLGLSGLGSNLGLLDLSGNSVFISECSESVWLHVSVK
jgi:hypothetical protein